MDCNIWWYKKLCHLQRNIRSFSVWCSKYFTYRVVNGLLSVDEHSHDSSRAVRSNMRNDQEFIKRISFVTLIFRYSIYMNHNRQKNKLLLHWHRMGQLYCVLFSNYYHGFLRIAISDFNFCSRVLWKHTNKTVINAICICCLNVNLFLFVIYFHWWCHWIVLEFWSAHVLLSVLS